MESELDINISFPVWTDDYLRCTSILSTALNFSLAKSTWLMLLNKTSLIQFAETIEANSKETVFEKALLYDDNYTIIAMSSSESDDSAVLYPRKIYTNMFHGNIPQENQTSTAALSTNFLSTSKYPQFGILHENSMLNMHLADSFSDLFLYWKNPSKSINQHNFYNHSVVNTMTSAMSDSIGTAYTPLPDIENGARYPNISLVASVTNWCLEEASDSSRPYLLDWWQQVLWTLVFSAMLAVAIGGNSLVMWVVCGKHAKLYTNKVFLMSVSL